MTTSLIVAVFYFLSNSVSLSWGFSSSVIAESFRNCRRQRRHDTPWLLPCAMHSSSSSSNVEPSTFSENDHTANTQSTNKNQPQWITCSSTKELTHAIERLVQPGDHVAELGAQLREASTAICKTLRQPHQNHNHNRNRNDQRTSSSSQQQTGRAVLVDTVRKYPKHNSKNNNHSKQGPLRTKAMRREGDEENFFPQFASFMEIDKLDDWRQTFFPSAQTSTSTNDSNTSNNQSPSFYNVFVVDLSCIVGNDLEWTTLSLVREFLALNDNSSNSDNNNRCRLVLIKSLSLNQWASRLIHGQRWIRQGGEASRTATTTSTTTATLNGSNCNSTSLCHIVATVGVLEYRETIPHTVRPGDAVLEIGCHLGTSTALLHDAVSIGGSGSQDNSIENNMCSNSKGYCIGVDIGTFIIKGAKQRHPHIFFAVGDAWRTAALLRTQQDFFGQQIAAASTRQGNDHNLQQGRIGFDVVYVDVGGLSGQDGLMESLSLISALANSLEPRCIVIKSVCMRRLSSTLVPYWKLQKHQ